MSRLGKIPIQIPKGVEVKVEVRSSNSSAQSPSLLSNSKLSTDQVRVVSIKGPKGLLEREFPEFIDIKVADGHITVAPARELVGKFERAMWGTVRSHIANMVKGVSEGWEKSLEINGIGYAFKISGKTLMISCGYSHDVIVAIPEGINCTVERNILKIVGIDKELVGNFAGKVLGIKKADVYLGKGIKYVGQTLRRKAGKSVKK